MPPRINTLYLVPHSHTDIGYSHDPLVATELHIRFLDRAIELCEHTRGRTDGSAFHWTIEVFATLLSWWEHRSPQHHARLRQCLDRGEIEIGARYLNGTELYSPLDADWEVEQWQRVVELTGHRPTVAVQNDVNGFPMALADRLSEAGVDALVMGLNTTMGHSPFPRCYPFRWKLDSGRSLLVWNGWIYNRLKSYCHLDRLAEDFPGKTDAFFETLRPDYPYDFAVTTATMGDNVGPFVHLPDQVAAFNAKDTGLRLEITTFRRFCDRLSDAAVEVPVHAGHWTDGWTFGLGAMPQMTAGVRRAQRRLRLVQAIRTQGWAHADGGSLTLDRARRDLASACEHTYDSHTSNDENTGSSDALRQKAQTHFHASAAESASMVLLRDHLSMLAEGHRPAEPAVLAVNPHDHELTLDYLTDRRGMLQFAQSHQPEHLFQFDREPTAEALRDSGTYGVLNVSVPPRAISQHPLVELDAGKPEPLPPDKPHDLSFVYEKASLRYDPDRAGLTSWRIDGHNWINAAEPYAAFEPVIEHPDGPFQNQHGGEVMDPTDVRWRDGLTMHQQRLRPEPTNAERVVRNRAARFTTNFKSEPLRRFSCTLDARHPSELSVQTDWRFDADPTQRAYYLALPLTLPGSGPCEFRVDACGHWFRAGVDQLPGSCHRFYQAFRGVAISRASHTLYIASPDTTLFQFGGFTFDLSPDQPLDFDRPFVALWVYNNYWGTNFPSYSPGQFTARYRLRAEAAPFHAETADQLWNRFDTDYLTHPLA